MSKSFKTIKSIIKTNQTKDLDKLSSEGKIFAEFLLLIVDIKYKNKYGEVAKQNTYDYSDDIQLKNVLPDQVTPVDDGLVGH